MTMSLIKEWLFTPTKVATNWKSKGHIHGGSVKGENLLKLKNMQIKLII